jgi:outer membrane murein-binding lipoprotein Lpp
MVRPRSLRALLFAAALAGSPAGLRAQSGASAEEIDQLKSQIAALQAQVSALAAKVESLPAAPPAPTPTPASGPPGGAPAEVAVPAGAAGAGGPAGSLPYYGNAATASKVFNPDISAIGDFVGAIGKSPGGGEPSLELHEAELGFQAIVDPYARADFFLTYGPDEIGVEEAYVTFPAAPGDLLLKAGKMRDAFGKVDAMHIHVLPFTDRPLVTQNLTGGEDGLADYGVSLARLIPNPWLFLEATGQVYRGRSEVFSGETRSDLAYVGHLRAYRDLGDSSNVDLGGSIAYGTNDSGEGFHTRLLGVDATYRWRPLRRAIYRRFLGRTELVWSRREEPATAWNAFGFYVSAEYQFARRWIGGGRFDYSERATDPFLVDKGGSLLLTYWPSEFSQIRGQYRYTHFGEGRIANEFLFQLLFSIGAHGAHVF